MREKDYYGAIKGFCLKWNLPEVWNSDRITGANLVYEVIKVINAMILEQKEVKEMIEDFLLMFNEDLDETVNNILIEWKESGMLEDIINEALFNQKLNKSVYEDFIIKNEDIDIKVNNVLLDDGLNGTYFKYYLIPKANNDGSKNNFKLDYFEEGNTIEHYEDTMIVVNAGYFKTEDLSPMGTTIIDGELIAVNDHLSHLYNNVAWNDDEFITIPLDYSFQEIINTGAMNCYGGGFTLVENNIKKSVIAGGWGNSQRTIIGEVDGMWFVGLNSGRSSNQAGLNLHTITNYLLDKYDVKFLYMNDGGSSSQGRFYGKNIITPSEENYSKFRKVPTFIKIVKTNIEYEKNNSRLENIEKTLNNIDLLNENLNNVSTQVDLNLIKETSLRYAYSGSLNKPSIFVDANGFVLSVLNGSGQMTQLFIPLLTNASLGTTGIAFRSKNDGEWSKWLTTNDSPGISWGSNIGDLTHSGKVYVLAGVYGNPVNKAGFVDTVFTNQGVVQQRFYPLEGDKVLLTRRGNYNKTTKQVTWLAWQGL